VAGGCRITNVLFFYYGTIYVLDRFPGGAEYALVGDWDLSGDYHKYSIHIDPCTPFKCVGGDNDAMPCNSDMDCAGPSSCNGRIEYLIDDVVAYEGTNWTGGGFTDQLLLYSDNTGGIGHPGIDIDDVEIIRGEPCLGACCDAFGCVDLEASEPCEGQSFFPHMCGSEFADCPPVTMGACCDRLAGTCTETTESGCTGNSTFSLGTHCAPGVCQPDKGACCVQTPFDASCSVTKDVDCTGFFAPGSDCTNIACAPEVIPTVSEWGVVVMVLVLLVGGRVYFGRRAHRAHGS